MIERLELRNFTAFTDLAMDLSPKINVIIGENGTGKTHLLKAAYGLFAGAPLFKNKPDISEDELQAALTAKLLRLFMPLDDKLGKMHRQGATDQAYLSARFAGGQNSYLYRHAEQKVDKPIHYICLITFDNALNSRMQKSWKMELPVGKASRRCVRALATSCHVVNVDKWNENFPKWPVTRLVAAAVGGA